MKHRLAQVLLAATTSCACSERTLNAERAVRLIAALDGFKREAHFTVHTGVPLRSAFKCLSQAEVERMPLNKFAMERGWVRYESREAIFNFGTKATCPSNGVNFGRRGGFGNMEPRTRPLRRRRRLDGSNRTA